MLTIIGQDIISGNMGYIGTEPGRLYRMGPRSKVAEASGEPPVVLADCKKKPLKGLKIYGRSVQKTTTGAQLLDVKQVIGNEGKIVSTQYENYIIAIQGIYAEGDTNAWRNVRILLDSALAGKTITASLESAENDAGEPLRNICDINYAKQDGSISWNYFGVDNPKTIAIPAEATSLVCRIHIIENTSGSAEYGTYTTTVKGLMISIGDKVLPWEPYAGGQPSPSPDYPQEVESVGMRWSTGANLLDISQWNTYEKTYGLTCTIENDTVTIKGVYERPNYEIGTRIQAMYRLLRYKTGTTFPDGAKVAAQIIKGDGAEGIYVSSGLKENTPCIVIAFYAVTGQEVEIQLKPMIYVGDTVPEWEPYTGGVPKPYGDKIGITIRNGVDEADAPQSMSISTPNGLPGIPVASGGNYTDPDGQQWICDEIDFARGMYVQRVAYTTVDGDAIKFKARGEFWNLPDRSSPGCDDVNSAINNFFSKNMFGSNGRYNFIYALSRTMEKYFETIDKLNEFCKTQYDAGTPLILYYALSTQVETPLTSDQLAAYKALRTYKGTTIIDNDAGAYMSVKYNT